MRVSPDAWVRGNSSTPLLWNLDHHIVHVHASFAHHVSHSNTPCRLDSSILTRLQDQLSFDSQPPFPNTVHITLPTIHIMLPTILLPLTFALLTHALPSPNFVPITVSPGIPYVPPGHPPVSCTNISTGISSHCFTNLTIARYLSDWNTSYPREVCTPTQTWSTCYLSYAYATNVTQAGFDGHPRPTTSLTAANATALHDCSTLNGNSSTNGCPPPQLSLPPTAGPQTFYSVLNIYNVHQHLTVWSQAIATNTSLPGIDYLIEDSNGHVNEALDSATGLLQSVVARFGRSGPADAALINL